MNPGKVEAVTDSEKLDAILDEQRALRALLELLLAQREESRAKPEPTRANDLVDVEYFSRVTGLAPDTIRHGKAGTYVVPRQGKRPSVWLKRDVDTWQRARAAALRLPKEKALLYLEKWRA